MRIFKYILYVMIVFLGLKYFSEKDGRNERRTAHIEFNEENFKKANPDRKREIARELAAKFDDKDETPALRRAYGDVLLNIGPYGLKAVIDQYKSSKNGNADLLKLAEKFEDGGSAALFSILDSEIDINQKFKIAIQLSYKRNFKRLSGNEKTKLNLFLGCGKHNVEQCIEYVKKYGDVTVTEYIKHAYDCRDSTVECSKIIELCNSGVDPESCEIAANSYKRHSKDEAMILELSRKTCESKIGSGCTHLALKLKGDKRDLKLNEGCSYGDVRACDLLVNYNTAYDHPNLLKLINYCDRNVDAACYSLGTSTTHPKKIFYLEKSCKLGNKRACSTVDRLKNSQKSNSSSASSTKDPPLTYKQQIWREKPNSYSITIRQNHPASLKSWNLSTYNSGIKSILNVESKAINNVFLESLDFKPAEFEVALKALCKELELEKVKYNKEGLKISVKVRLKVKTIVDPDLKNCTGYIKDMKELDKKLPQVFTKISTSISQKNGALDPIKYLNSLDQLVTNPGNLRSTVKIRGKVIKIPKSNPKKRAINRLRKASENISIDVFTPDLVQNVINNFAKKVNIKNVDTKIIAKDSRKIVILIYKLMTRDKAIEHMKIILKDMGYNVEWSKNKIAFKSKNKNPTKHPCPEKYAQTNPLKIEIVGDPDFFEEVNVDKISNLNFPEGVKLDDLIRTAQLWTGQQNMYEDKVSNIWVSIITKVPFDRTMGKPIMKIILEQSGFVIKEYDDFNTIMMGNPNCK